jgi:peptidoglycan/xylan/chitin deacetylase (PgdA/CDA1 family)
VTRAAPRRSAQAAAAAAAAVHVGPLIASWAPLRRALLPALAGTGLAGHVALTFDDGPDRASTPAVLDALERHSIKATFFFLGTMLRRDPALGKDVAAAGHELAVHGWEHRCLLTRGPRTTRDDIVRARDAVAAVTGSPPRWYRPPYGVLTGSALLAARDLGLTPILWTAWGRDWNRRATPSSVAATVGRHLMGGGTVLLHDSDCTSTPGSWRATLGALPSIIEAAHQRGLVFGPLAEHFENGPGGAPPQHPSMSPKVMAGEPSGQHRRRART